MGRKKPQTGRKKTLQLTDSRKSEGSQLTGKGIYAQAASTATVEATAPDKPPSPGPTSEEQQSSAGMDSRLADFMKEIHSLGSRDDIEDSSSADPDGVTEASEAKKELVAQSGGEGGGENNQDRTLISLEEQVPQKSAGEAPPTFWHQVVDTNSNHPYYWNPLTNEVSWVLPDGGVISYDGVYGGDEQGEPLDYFAYYDQGLVVREKKADGSGRGRGGGGEGKSTKEGRVEREVLSGETAVKLGAKQEERARKSEEASDITAGETEGRTAEDSSQEEDRPSVMEATPTGPSAVVTESVTTEEGSEEWKVGMGEAVVDATVTSGDGIKEGAVPIGPPLPPGYGEKTCAEVMNHDQISTSGTKRKLDQDVDEGNDGDVQLMPTSKAPAGNAVDSVSPPLKISRSSRSHGRGMEDKTTSRKTRSTYTPTSSAAKQEQQALRFQVSSLADELSRKLQFLHLSIDGLADMQILQVQVKTRISDWEEGGLDTKFLLSKLKQASEDLLYYEQQAAPKGWRFLWDSTTCRYQFQHLSTGEVSWEYPTSSLSEGDAESSDVSDQEEEEMVQSPPLSPVQPPPPPPPSLPPSKPIKPVSQASSTGQKAIPPTSTKRTSAAAAAAAASTSVLPATKKVTVKSAALPQQVTRSLIQDSESQQQRAKSNPSQAKGKDLATPTAAYLRGGEMVQAPLPRSWKYENDELNRRVRREGSIERREEVAERELSPTDVRRKLVKRVLPVPQPSPRGPGSTQSKQIKESVDLSDFPPSPPSSPPPPPHPPAPSSSLLVPTPQKEAAVAKKEPAFPSDDSKSDRKRGDIATPLSPHPPRPPAPSNSHLVPTSQKAAAVAEGVSTAIAKKEAAFSSDESKSDRDSGDVVKEALQVLSSQLRGDKETPKKSQQKDKDHGSREESTLMPPAPKLPPPPPPPSQTPSMQATREESEAKMRERLIERAKRLRKAVNDGRTVPGLPDEERTVQSEGVEESTGIVYPHQEEGERRSQREHTSLAPKLIKSSFTQIHVSYDRIEPETGESENVAVEVDGGSREGRRGAGLTPQMEEGELVSSEETEGELGTPLRDEVLAKLAAEDDKGSSIPDAATLEVESALDSSPVSDLPLVDDTEPGQAPVSVEPMREETHKKSERESSSERGGTRDDREGFGEIVERAVGSCEQEMEDGRKENRSETVTEGGTEENGREGKEEEDTSQDIRKVEKRAEEGEITSRSPTPIAQPTGITPRCYMDKEEDTRRGREKDKRDQHYYDSDRSGYSDRDNRHSSSHKRLSYSRSRSRSRSRDPDHYSARSSKRRRGDTSDYSDYDGGRYSDTNRKSRYSSKHRRRGDHSDYSGSDYSDDRYAHRRRNNYDSDPNYRDRAGERHSRRSRTDDDRSSRRHKNRSRSRSRSKESRDSGKRNRDKSKKKKRDKKEKRHKKDRRDDNGQPKVPKKVTVGRVGKLSSLRTLGNKKADASEGGDATGSGDTPLDKVQAAIAESIEEKQKQERQVLEQREETRKLESKIQKHVQSSRLQFGQQAHSSSSPVAPIYPAAVYPQVSPTDLSQGQYYAYSGYQYPYAGQNWTGTQWAAAAAAPSSGVDQQAALYAQAGTGEQYGSAPATGTGTGEEQYGGIAPSGSGTGEQQYGGIAPSGSGTSEQQYGGIAPSRSGTSEQKYGDTGEQQYGVTREQQYGDTGEQPYEDSGEQQYEDSGEAASTPPMQQVQPAVQSLQSPPVKPESEAGTHKSGDVEEIITPAIPHAPERVVVSSGKEMKHHPDSTDDVAATCEESTVAETCEELTVAETCEESNVAETCKELTVLPEIVSAAKEEEGAEEVEKEESDKTAECEMEIESEQDSPVATVAPVSAATTTTTTSESGESTGQICDVKVNEAVPQVGDTPPATKADISSTPPSEKSDIPSNLKGPRDQEPESSPEPLPPGVEVEQKTVASLAQAQTLAEKSSVSEKTVETKAAAAEESGIETEEPAPPGMEPEQPATTTPTQEATQKETSPTPNSEVEEAAMDTSQTPPPADYSPPPGPQPTTSAAPTPSVPATPPSSAATPSASRVSMSPYESQVAAAYYASPSSQGYDIAVAAAAYAQATNTGQPYQYHQYLAAQTGYDYATYSAYLQQMGQSAAGGMYGSGYVLGADGQYYQQPNPYGAYAAAAAAGGYGGYYSSGGVPAYSYGSPAAYQTATQQQIAAVSTTTTSSETEKREKAKKGEFALPDSKEKQVKNMMSKWSSFKES